MKKWFEKWNYEKKRRRERGQPLVVQYRDENYVSAGDPGVQLTAVVTPLTSVTPTLYLYAIDASMSSFWHRTPSCAPACTPSLPSGTLWSSTSPTHTCSLVQPLA